ncbi:MAG: DNA-3-methyladenine glycosylase family protein [Candidatus Hermodarchaeia archaeon]|jgi:DNA-3-methyladenine glycosylase II
MSEIHGFQVELERPFDLDATVDSWVFSDVQPTPEQKRPGEFARCIPINNELIPVRVVQLRHGAHPSLQVQWPAKFGGDHSAITSTVEWLLGWDIDTRPVLRAIKKDPVISHLAKPLQGLRPFSHPTFFEAIVKAILQQQVSFRSANQVTRRLVLEYGSKCLIGEEQLYGFPKLQTLSALSDSDLRACKLGFKVPYLMGLFEVLSSGSLKLDELAQLDTSKVIERLDALRGVGLWTAELAVLTGLRQLDVFPADDLGIRQIISRLYLNGNPAKRVDVEVVAERWGGVKSQVLYFLMCAQVLGLL